jgi:hypothetical protein
VVASGQLVIGDHDALQPPKGAKVTILQAGERPLRARGPIRCRVVTAQAERLLAWALPDHAH